eukprot:5963130-Pleurochrysis_carterae.AAC.1
MLGKFAAVGRVLVSLLSETQALVKVSVRSGSSVRAEDVYFQVQQASFMEELQSGLGVAVSLLDLQLSFEAEGPAPPPPPPVPQPPSPHLPTLTWPPPVTPPGVLPSPFAPPSPLSPAPWRPPIVMPSIPPLMPPANPTLPLSPPSNMPAAAPELCAGASLVQGLRLGINPTDAQVGYALGAGRRLAGSPGSAYTAGLEIS